MIHLITFLTIDECHRRLEVSFDQNYRKIMDGAASAQSAKSDKFFIGRTLTSSRFEIQLIDPVGKYSGKTFIGRLQSFSTGTKVRGELHARSAEMVSRIVVVLMLFFMLILSLRNLAENVGAVFGLIAIFVVVLFLEIRARKRKAQYEQPFVEYLESTLQAMSLGSNRIG